MITPLRNLMYGWHGSQRGFTLIELLIVILIIGILAAVGIPLYIGYVRDAKTAEGKAVAGSLWTSLQAQALSLCGNAVNASSVYQRAGLTAAGATTPVRWQAANTSTLEVACDTGVYNAGAANLFTITGVAADVLPIVVQLNYVAGNTPPARMQCSVDTGTTFTDC